MAPTVRRRGRRRRIAGAGGSIGSAPRTESRRCRSPSRAGMRPPSALGYRRVMAAGDRERPGPAGAASLAAASPDGGGRRAGRSCSPSRRWSPSRPSTTTIRSADPAFDPPGDRRRSSSRMLAITLPLAWRRRFPLLGRGRRDGRLPGRPGRRRGPRGLPSSHAGRVVWRSAAPPPTARRPRSRTLACSPLCLGAIVGEVVRELFFVERGRRPDRSLSASSSPTTPSSSPCPWCSGRGHPVAAGAGAGSWPSGPPSCSASARRTPVRPCSTSGCASPASCTTSSPTTSA